MGQHADEHLAVLGGIALGRQRRAQAALVPREHALGLDALAVLELGEPALHLPAVLGLGPLSAARENNGGHPLFLIVLPLLLFGCNRVGMVSQSIEVYLRCSFPLTKSSRNEPVWLERPLESTAA
jgi:hypothetical protein